MESQPLRQLAHALAAGLVFTLSVHAETLAYWPFDTFSDGETAAAVGGAPMTLQSAGTGTDFAVTTETAVETIPNPDGSPGFQGDSLASRGALTAPGKQGVNRHLATATGTNILHLNHNAWTVEGWIRCHDEEPQGFGHVILTTRDQPAWSGLTLKVDRPPRMGRGRRLSCLFEVRSQGDGETDATFTVMTDGILHPGTWHHMALVWDATGDQPPTATLFVDGIQAAQAFAPPHFDAATADRHAIDRLHLGGRLGSAANSFAGDLDEFRISRGALHPRDMLLAPRRTGPLPRLHRMATPRDLHPAAPRASDVLMRALRWRPIHERDPHDTMQTMDAFHVTGLVWAYIHDPEIIAEILASGRFFQGAVTNSLATIRDLLGLGRNAGPEETAEFVLRYGCKSLDGSPNEQPWKRHWPNPFARNSGCCSNPEFAQLYVRALQTYLSAGATMIQRDEGGGNAERPNYGGCFCDHCMSGFRLFLKERLEPAELAELGIANPDTFDYRHRLHAEGAPVGDAFARWNGGRLQHLFQAYQHRISVKFMAETRAALQAAAGFPVPMSCNNGVRSFDEVMEQFDWFFGELSRSHATPENLYRTAAMAAGMGRLQIVTMPKKGEHSLYDTADGWQRHTRQTIATSYAVGGLCMVPWDVYMPDTIAEDRQRTSTPRYFGKPDEYADLFAFIRANSRLLDGYEDAAAIGPGLLDPRWGQTPPVALPASDEVYAFLRARPDDAEAPVAVHLIDWRDQPAPLVLHLRTECFFPGKDLLLTLHTPVPYDQSQHSKAHAEAQRLRQLPAGEPEPLGPRQASAYAALSQSEDLPSSIEGPWHKVSIPALAPWAILTVTPR